MSMDGAAPGGASPGAVPLAGDRRDLAQPGRSCPLHYAYRPEDVGAADAFQRALDLTDDEGLRLRSLYNLGTSAYAQSRQAVESPSDPGAAPFFSSRS